MALSDDETFDEDARAQNAAAQKASMESSGDDDSQDEKMDDEAEEEEEQPPAPSKSNKKKAVKQDDKEEGDAIDEEDEDAEAEESMTANNSSVSKGKIPQEYDHLVSLEEMVEKRMTGYGIIGSFGNVAIVDSKENAGKPGSAIVVAPNSAFTRPEGFKQTNQEWFDKVRRDHIVALKTGYAVRDKISPSQTTAGARGKTTHGEVCVGPKVVPMLNTYAENQDPNDSRQIDSQLTPLPPAFISTLYECGRNSLKKQSLPTQKREEWTKLMQALFFEPYGTDDFDKLDQIMADERNIWIFDTTKGAFENYIIKNKWHRYRLPKATSANKEKAPPKEKAKPASTGRGRKRKAVDEGAANSSTNTNSALVTVTETTSTNPTASNPSKRQAASNGEANSSYNDAAKGANFVEISKHSWEDSGITYEHVVRRYL